MSDDYIIGFLMDHAECSLHECYISTPRAAVYVQHLTSKVAIMVTHVPAGVCSKSLGLVFLH